MRLIAAVDKNWGIGCNNRLLANIPPDMKFFREATLGKIVVMGRKTLESFPDGLPLKNRTNIVFTTNEGYSKKGVITVHGLESLREALKRWYTDDVYVIGGESIYRQLLPLCDIAHITRIDYEFEADTYFPNLDEDEEWEMEESGKWEICSGLEYKFTIYKRVKSV